MVTKWKEGRRRGEGKEGGEEGRQGGRQEGRQGGRKLVNGGRNGTDCGSSGRRWYIGGRSHFSFTAVS